MVVDDMVFSALLVAALALRIDHYISLLVSWLLRQRISCNPAGEKNASSQDSLLSSMPDESVPECVQSLRSSESSISFDPKEIGRFGLVRKDSLKLQSTATTTETKPAPSLDLSVVSEDWMYSASEFECEEGSISVDDLAQTSIHDITESSGVSESFLHARPSERPTRNDLGMLCQEELPNSVTESYLYRSDSMFSYDGSTGSGSFDVAIKVSERVKRQLGRKTLQRDTSLQTFASNNSDASCTGGKRLNDSFSSSVHSATTARRATFSARTRSFGSGASSPSRQRRRMSSTSFLNERSKILRDNIKKRGLSRDLKSRPKKSDDRKILDRLHSSGLSAAAFCR